MHLLSEFFVVLWAVASAASEIDIHWYVVKLNEYAVATSHTNTPKICCKSLRAVTASSRRKHKHSHTCATTHAHIQRRMRCSIYKFVHECRCFFCFSSFGSVIFIFVLSYRQFAAIPWRVREFCAWRVASEFSSSEI